MTLLELALVLWTTVSEFPIRRKSLKTDGKDVDIEGEELLQKKSFSELLQIFKAYHVLTGHQVTHCNSEPRCYISGCITYWAKKRMASSLKCHQFPWMYPLYEHGSKHYISPSVPVDGEEVGLKLTKKIF